MSRFITQQEISAVDTEIEQLQEKKEVLNAKCDELVVNPPTGLSSSTLERLVKAKLDTIDYITEKIKRSTTEREELNNAFQKQERDLQSALAPPSKKPCLDGPITLNVASCSSASATDISECEVTGYVFHHKFAIALYDLGQRLTSKSDCSTFNFMGTTYKPSMIYLDELVTKWSIFSKLRDERAMTPYLACALNNFLFFGKDEGSRGYCLHQGAIYGSRPRPNFPDFCVVPFDHDNDPTSCVAIADFKKDKLSAAVIESSAYSLRSKEDRWRELRLVFPITRHAAKLIIHYPIENKVVAIRVYPLEDDEEGPPDQIFFCMLYAGVHQLLKEPIFSKGMLDITSQLALYPSIVVKSNTITRIFVDKDGRVYKFFGHNAYSKAMIDVVKVVFPNAEEVFLTGDEHYSYITYDYVHGSHHPCMGYESEQFATLLEQLYLIHEKGYVHSDIRESNLVFHDNSANASLIDFDLAGEEGTCYPSEYRSNLPFRHPDAQPNNPRDKKHDVYSLSAIAVERGSASSFFEEFIRGKTLKDIAKKLREPQEQT